MSDNFSLSVFDVTQVGNVAERWRRWLRSFEFMCKGRAISDPEQQGALLMHLAGEQVQDIYETLSPVGDETKKNEYEVVVDRLNEHFIPKTNKTFERHLFRKMTQEKESCDQFYTRLRQSAVKCEFVDEDENIKGQFIDGCKDKRLRRRILEKGEITLTEVMKLARAFEVSESQERSYAMERSVVNFVKPTSSGPSKNPGGKTYEIKKKCSNNLKILTKQRNLEGATDDSSSLSKFSKH